MNKLEKTLLELRTAQIVKEKHVSSFLPKTIDKTALHCTFCIYPFALSRAPHLPRAEIGTDTLNCIHVLWRAVVKTVL